MSHTERTWNIYALLDPRSERVRYVGWAFDVNRRLRQHVQRSGGETTHKANWLKELSVLGLKPDIQILESGEGDWAGAEQRWIAHFRAIGADLTNATDGGEGVIGLVFDEVSRMKMSNAKRGKPIGAERAAKLHEAARGKRRPEVGKAISAAKMGHAVTETTRQRMSLAMTGRRHTEVTKAKMAATRTAKDFKHSEETKAKIRQSHTGKTLTSEHRLKLAAAKAGRLLSEEHKAKIRASSGGWKHTPEAIAKITAARRARSSK